MAVKIIFEEFKRFLNIFMQLYLMTRAVLAGILFIIIILALLFAYVENIRVGDAIYFAFITALTIGYGDIVPHTPIGKVISILIGFFGFNLFGITVGISTLSVRETVKTFTGKEL